jgi:hypothetical protein
MAFRFVKPRDATPAKVGITTADEAGRAPAFRAACRSPRNLGFAAKLSNRLSDICLSSPLVLVAKASHQVGDPASFNIGAGAMALATFRRKNGRSKPLK